MRDITLLPEPMPPVMPIFGMVSIILLLIFVCWSLIKIGPQRPLFLNSQ
jgi:flagellar biogenesis protein FliO